MYIHEQHQDNRLHVHMISTSMLNTRWWKDNAPRCGFGYIVEEENVRSEVAVAKYALKHLAGDLTAGADISREVSTRARAEMTKQLRVHRWPKNWRRVTTSRGWPPLPEWENAPGWEWVVLFTEDELHDEVYAALAEGYNWQHVDYRDAYSAMYEASELARMVRAEMVNDAPAI